jgi:cytoskeleton protein RodZ
LRFPRINAKQFKINIFIADSFMNKEKTVRKDFLGLRTKREASGLTLKDVFNTTRVSVVNLEAIENGDFHDLPVSIYTKNFIKTYARALNIDSKPILDSYEAYLNSLQVAQTQLPEPQPEKEPYLKKIGRYKTYIWAASIIIVIAIVALMISMQYQPAPEVVDNQPKTAAAVPQVFVLAPVVNSAAPTDKQVLPSSVPNAVETAKQGQTTPAPNGQKNTVVSKSIPQQIAPKVEKKESAPIGEESGILMIKSTEETWLKIRVDQKPSFQVLLKPGEIIKREGASFDIDIGNAGGIIMQYKGKVIENLGKSGQVIHLRLP